MQKTIEVVDGFYRKPVAVRELALRNSEWIQPSTDEVGMYSARTTAYAADEEARARIFEVLRRTPVGDREMAIRGFFTFIGASASDRLVPHVHDADWAGVVYLSLPEQCSGGIAFYQRANAVTLDPTTHASSIPSSQAWEETMYVPMRFNRMVLFRASFLFHRAACGFGQTPESGRLAQVFLFNEVSALVTE